MKYLLALSGLLLGACGQVDYETLPAGRFDGALFVMWVGEGSGLAGDGRFVYVPMPDDPLTFTRTNPDATVTVIRPEVMYTDGGSIPRIAQPLRGLSPWGYAPGYMIHDWLFQAKHCVTDGRPTPQEARIAVMPFTESAEVLGEAIKTLIAERRVRPDDVAPRAISSAVAGPISRSLWRRGGACPEPRISAAHKRQIENALGRMARTGTADRSILSDDPLAPPPPRGPEAAIVSVVRF